MWNNLLSNIIGPGILRQQASANTYAYKTRVEADGGIVVNDTTTLGNINNLPQEADTIFTWFSTSGVKYSESVYVSKLYSLFSTTDIVQNDIDSQPILASGILDFDGIDDYITLDITGYQKVIVVAKRDVDSSFYIYDAVEAGIGEIHDNILYIGTNAEKDGFFELQIKAILILDVSTVTDTINYLKSLYSIVTTPSTTTYYFSNAGDDITGDGSIDNPFATIDKSNSLTGSTTNLVYLFKRGDTFEGTIESISNIGNPHWTYVGSYGTGNKPVISCAPEIIGWTLHSGNIYKKVLSEDINQLFIDGSRANIARYPKEGYYDITTVNSTTQFTSTNITSQAADYYKDALVVLKMSRYNLQSKLVTTSSGQTLTIDEVPYSSLKVDYGFFLINKLEFLTQAGEWYYDSATKTVYAWMPNSDAPSNYVIRGSNIPNGLRLQTYNNYVKDINISYASSNAVLLDTYSDGNIVKNVDIIYPAINGIYGTGSGIVNNIIEDCYVYGAMDSSIQLIGGDGNIIKGNEFRYAGQLDNINLNTSYSTSPGQNVYLYNCDNSQISYNNIYDSGYAAIKYNFGNYHIHHNYIDGACQVFDDGGALYTYTGPTYTTPSAIGSVLEYNIIKNSWGTPEGINNTTSYGYGIYFDSHTWGVTATNNTVIGTVGGMLIGTNKDMILTNNIFYDFNVGIIEDGETPTNFSNNTLVQANRVGTYLGWTNENQRFIKKTDTLNYYTDYSYNRYIAPYGTDELWWEHADFAAWTAASGETDSSFITPTFGTNEVERIVYNHSKKTRTFYLNNATGVINLKDNSSITTSFTLDPYESLPVYGTNINSIQPYLDNTAPVITDFTIPETGNNIVIPISTFVVTDDNEVDSYMITETSTTPNWYDENWSTTIPTTYTVATVGVKTLYAWAKDKAGNISAYASDTITITASELLEKAVAWYEFEETSGTTLVDETGNHNGTIQAGVTINQDNGVMGKSHTMANVASSYNVIPDDDALTLGESWTIGMVIKPTTLDSEKVYVRKNNEYRIGVTNDGRVMCYQYSSGGTTIRIQKFTGTNVIVTGNTYWVTVTFTGSTFEVEVNGESKALSDSSAGTYVGMTNTSNNLVIGNTVSSGTIIGDMGQLALFVTALSTQGRADYYNLGSGVTYASL